MGFVSNNTLMSQTFCNTLVCASLRRVYYEAFQVMGGYLAVIGGIVVVSELIRFALLNCVWFKNLTDGRTTLCYSAQLINVQFKKFRSVCKNIGDQAKSGRPKTICSEAVLQAREANPVSSELATTQSNVVCSLRNLYKNIQSCWIVPHIIRILQNFRLTLVFEGLIYK